LHFHLEVIAKKKLIEFILTLGDAGLVRRRLGSWNAVGGDLEIQ
jgi:hypothetical protein